MAVTFVIGRAGSGKTRRCLKSIADALRKSPLGPAIYWLVPRQATFSLERELTCAAGLGGFTRARVVSFEQLARDILADSGGGAIPEITTLGRQMILGHLLRKHEGELKFFKSVARQAGLAGKLDATFTEIERCGKDCADLATLHEAMQADERDNAGTALLDKVHDLHLIYAAYEKYLGQDRLDPHRRLLQVLGFIDNSRLLRGADVYVDGFVEFTEYECRILARLGKVCRKVEIALLMDPASPLLRDSHRYPEELSLLHRCESTYRKLWFTFREEQTPLDETIVLSTIHRYQTPALAAVERQVFGPRAAQRDLFGQLIESRRDATGIELMECSNPRAEVDAAARKIRALTASGLRLRDIAVVVRELEPYHELIDASFREHGIEYFLDRRRAVSHHPLIAFLRSAILLAQQAWPHETVMTLLKTSLAGLDNAETDELENYVLQHRVRGAAWTQEEPWQFKRQLTRGADTEIFFAEETATRRIDELRRGVVDKLRPFIAAVSAPTLSISQLAAGVFELFDRFDIRRTLGDWIQVSRAANEIEQANEHQQVWTALVDLFDQMVELLGGELVSLADFQAILESGLEQFTLALTPPAVDQLLVGQVDRTRTPDVKAVLVLGLGDGVFPHAVREDIILSDAERRQLAERNLEVDPDTERRLLDEEMLGYIALTRASHQLYVSRPLADDHGKSLGPSPYWRRLQLLFPGAPIKQVPAEQRGSIDLIDTPRQLITSLMRWVRTTPDEKAAASPWLDLYQWLAKYPCAEDSIDAMRYRAWRALSYDNTASLSAPLARELFPAPFRASVTRVETFTACPFKHFLQYGIALRPRDDQDVTSLDLGNVFHHVLEQIVHRLVSQKQSWADLSPDRRTKLISEYAQEIAESLRGEIMMSSARNRYLLQRIENTLQQVVAAQEAAARRGSFHPAFAELTFGRGGGDLPAYELTTPAGKTVHLTGKIDRVDITDQGVFSVIDYKLRGDSLKLDRVYHGLSLQLLTYLLVMQANGSKLAGRMLTPAAAFYVRLLRSLDTVDHPSDALAPDDKRFDLMTKPRGLVDKRFISAIDRELTTGTSDVVSVAINKDGQLGRRGNDAAETVEFAGLMEHVRLRLGESLDRLLAGQVDVRPYRLNLESPCTHCDFRSVCRFEPAINSYRTLVSMKKETVFQRVQKEAGNGQ